MKYCLCFVLLFLSLSTPVLSQDCDAHVGRKVDFINRFKLESVVQFDHNSYILESDNKIARVDRLGNVLWEREIKNNKAWIVNVVDSNLIIISNDFTSKYDESHIIAFDRLGTKIFESNTLIGLKEPLFHKFLTDDSGRLLGFGVRYTDPDPSNLVFCVAEFDKATGKYVVLKDFISKDFHQVESIKRVNNVIVNSGGGYTVLVSLNESNNYFADLGLPFNGYNLVFIKMDVNFTIIEEKHIGNVSNFYNLFRNEFFDAKMYQVGNDDFVMKDQIYTISDEKSENLRFNQYNKINPIGYDEANAELLFCENSSIYAYKIETSKFVYKRKLPIDPKEFYLFVSRDSLLYFSYENPSVTLHKIPLTDSICTNVLYGKVVVDLNNNCTIDSSDITPKGYFHMVGKTIYGYYFQDFILETNELSQSIYYRPNVGVAIEGPNNSFSGLDTFSCGLHRVQVSFPTASENVIDTVFLVNLNTKCYNLSSFANFTTFRACEQNDFSLVLSNNGLNSNNGLLSLVLPSGVSFSSLSLPFVTIGDTVKIIIDKLLFGEQLIISGKLWVDCNEDLEVSKCFGLTYKDDTDCKVTSQFCRTPLSAFDPNTIKNLNPEYHECFDSIPNNKKLCYTIHFQNTGSDYARNVSIVNIIDEKLDIKSISKISCSAPDCKPILNETLGQITWDMPYYYLPAFSADSINSSGYVSYCILPKTIIKDSLINFAEIYFDHNPAVKTNVSTLYECAVSSVESVDIEYNLKPNPFADQLQINNLVNESRITVFDMFGRWIAEPKNSEIINTSEWPEGIVFIKVETADGRINVLKGIKQ